MTATADSGLQDAVFPDPIMVVHNRYQVRAGEDSQVDSEVAFLEQHGHTVHRFFVDSRSISGRGWPGRARLAVETVWSARAARQLAAEADRRRPAVIHVHNTFPLLSPAIYPALRATGAAVVQSLHNYRLICPSANLFRAGRDCTDCVGRRIAWPAVVHGCYRGSPAQSGVVAATLAVGRLGRVLERSVDAFVVPSRTVAESVAGSLLPTTVLAIKPNCVAPDPGSGSKGKRPDQYLFAGRLTAEKGLETILATWAELEGASTCRIAGTGPLAAKVARAAETSARIASLGVVDRSILLAEMRGARALVFPSIWREPFGLAIIEAFASGTPVIGAALGAPAELISDGVTGLLFAPGDPASLADRVRWASSHPAEMAAMGRRARAAYEASYTAERNYGRLIEIYRQALAARRRDRPPALFGVAADG